MNPATIALAKQACAQAIAEHSAWLETHATAMGNELLLAAYNAVRTALPKQDNGEPHALQPLAELVAQSLTLSDRTDWFEPLPTDVQGLLAHVDACTAHDLSGLQLHQLYTALHMQRIAYDEAIRRRTQQRARVAAHNRAPCI